MTSSYLVRIFDVLDSGSLVGRVTEVESGVALVFRNTDELVTFLGAGSDQLAARQRDESQRRR